MNIFLRCLILSFIFALLCGCGESRPHVPKLLGVIYQSGPNLELNDGLKKVIDVHADTLTSLDAQNDAAKQLAHINDLIQKNATVIFIAPVNLDAIKPGLVKAKEKGVACILLGAHATDPELLLCTVSADGTPTPKQLTEIGRIAAEQAYNYFEMQTVEKDIKVK